MDFEQAVSSSFRELSSEEMKKEQRQTLEAIGLDLREVLLPLLLIQKLLMEQPFLDILNNEKMTNKFLLILI